LADAEVAGALLDERVLCLLLGASTGLSLREWRGSSFLSGGFGRLSLRKEDISDCSTIAVFSEL